MEERLVRPDVEPAFSDEPIDSNIVHPRNQRPTSRSGRPMMEKSSRVTRDTRKSPRLHPAVSSAGQASRGYRKSPSPDQVVVQGEPTVRSKYPTGRTKESLKRRRTIMLAEMKKKTDLETGLQQAPTGDGHPVAVAVNLDNDGVLSGSDQVGGDGHIQPEVAVPSEDQHGDVDGGDFHSTPLPLFSTPALDALEMETLSTSGAPAG